MSTAWSKVEIDLIVADYFAMLADDLSKTPYNKAEHNRGLQSKISRSQGSIEFKHQNISAVLVGLGQPWISGYKPASNFQNALVDGVLRWLDANETWLVPKLHRSAATKSPVFEDHQLWIGPPPTHRNEPAPLDPEFMAAIGRKYDVAARDERNRALGMAGEELVLQHERATLNTAGRSDLADQVRWTAVEDGDGWGFDIQSF